ncbi:sulfite exporter TauE/SafE family protein [Azohydromonas lata]|uniref:Probable membrane transporter protein n=1 Tax=Azohydromonas lata TaxID=45677 RepID=A0ABU5IHT6_9BURK|nr:sulfite exporter TauE/SafE family protein [Azohydromonas lata]MDZ5458717.1 sulfite exporter TauE/SafE family protein [Azohydromonas lata]
MALDLGWLTFGSGAVICVAIAVAYLVFGMVGFGTALVASPALALYLPLAKIVPLLALMDMLAAMTNIYKDGRKADVQELKRLVPLMVVGSLVGAAILLKTRPEVMLLVLGIFVVAYSLYSLSKFSPKRKFNPGAAVPFGLVGGVFSALFGSGGFIYAIYLSGRIEQKEGMRVTQTTLIGLSTLTRVILFLLAGVYADISIVLLALVLLPVMLVGVNAGRRITLRLTRDQFIKIINVVVLCSGVVLIGRYLGQ